MCYGLGIDRENTPYICSKNQILVEGYLKYIFQNHKTSDKIYKGKLEHGVLLALTGRKHCVFVVQIKYLVRRCSNFTKIRGS